MVRWLVIGLLPGAASTIKHMDDNHLSTFGRIPRLRATSYPVTEKSFHVRSLRTRTTVRHSSHGANDGKDIPRPALISDNSLFLWIIAHANRFHCSRPRMCGERGGNGSSMWGLKVSPLRRLDHSCVFCLTCVLFLVFFFDELSGLLFWVGGSSGLAGVVPPPSPNMARLQRGR